MKYTPVPYKVLDSLQKEAFDRINWPPAMLVVDVLYIDPDPDSMSPECVDGPLGDAKYKDIHDAEYALNNAERQAQAGMISLNEFKQVLSKWEAISKKAKGI